MLDCVLTIVEALITSTVQSESVVMLFPEAAESSCETVTRIMKTLVIQARHRHDPVLAWRAAWCECGVR
ncbi:hypothetical protein E2C01_076151 [Portunus trituberculatus]|uniref:Uncharacterized protein n=1 Tax=Portunus trituberculatus TaxID=210409 RepID=A0A5B7IAP0_PORTR|nr:hypothetical protein [Portunus trituberculatus]